jgi:DNA-directed RNA polymerase subunit K/omega
MKKENLEVLLEDISSKFDLVLEGHAVLRGEIQELGRKTDERFDLVDLKIDALNKKMPT